jgi:hypothetical protein
MIDHNDKQDMTDEDLDRILTLASKPEPSSGFEARVLARIKPQASAEVIAFPQRKSPRAWVLGLPLAACLVIGVWLGASGDVSDLLPSSSSTSAMASADQLSPSGVDDIENLSAGDLS